MILLYNYLFIIARILNKILTKKEINSNIMPSLMQYYVALYNDNLELLHKLLDSGFKWESHEYGKMNLFVLDRNISKYFVPDEYINILKDNIKIFRNFYHSININKNNKDIDLEKIIQKFCNIVKTNVKNNKKENEDLLTVDLLLNFTEEEVLNLTNEQKYNLLNFKNNDDTSQLKLDLIKKYNYSKKIIHWYDFNKYFTIDEILKLTDEEIKLIESLFSNNYEYDNPDKIVESAITKFKNIKKINPNFNLNLESIAYDVLSIEQIMKMSESCAEKIEISCDNYRLYNVSSSFRRELSIDFTEELLRKFIKEKYYKDIIKRNVKKLIKK